MPTASFLAAAREEFLAAVAHYDAASPGLGGEFTDDVERAVARIETFPKHGAPYVSGTRRIVLRRFPFDLVYLESGEDILIVAVAHQRRSPYYWKRRV